MSFVAEFYYSFCNPDRGIAIVTTNMQCYNFRSFPVGFGIKIDSIIDLMFCVKNKSKKF